MDNGTKHVVHNVHLTHALVEIVAKLRMVPTVAIQGWKGTGHAAWVKINSGSATFTTQVSGTQNVWTPDVHILCAIVTTVEVDAGILEVKDIGLAATRKICMIIVARLFYRDEYEYFLLKLRLLRHIILIIANTYLSNYKCDKLMYNTYKYTFSSFLFFSYITNNYIS